MRNTTIIETFHPNGLPSVHLVVLQPEIFIAQNKTNNNNFVLQFFCKRVTWTGRLSSFSPLTTLFLFLSLSLSLSLYLSFSVFLSIIRTAVPLPVQILQSKTANLINLRFKTRQDKTLASASTSASTLALALTLAATQEVAFPKRHPRVSMRALSPINCKTIAQFSTTFFFSAETAQSTATAAAAAALVP